MKCFHSVFSPEVSLGDIFLIIPATEHFLLGYVEYSSGSVRLNHKFNMSFNNKLQVDKHETVLRLL